MTASENPPPPPTTAEMLAQAQRILDGLLVKYEEEQQAGMDAGRIPRSKEWFQRRLEQVRRMRIEAVEDRRLGRGIFAPEGQVPALNRVPPARMAPGTTPQPPRLA